MTVQRFFGRGLLYTFLSLPIVAIIARVMDLIAKGSSWKYLFPIIAAWTVFVTLGFLLSALFSPRVVYYDDDY